MKSLIALCLMLVSSLAMSQAVRYSPEDRIFWTEDTALTITYSPLGAPASVPASLATEVLADIEAKFAGLDLGGLSVRIGSRDLTTGCGDARTRNTVHICWEPRTGTTADSLNTGRTDGTSFWREGTIILSSSTTWTEASLYSTLMHYMLHILGFSHPSGESVQNGAADLSTLDIDGLRDMYGSTSCALTYDPATRTVTIPFVRYRGAAYTVRLQHNGGNDFTLVPGATAMFSATNMPTSRCQSLLVDANNEFRVPQVRVGTTMTSATLRFENGRLTLISRGQ